MNDSYSQQFGTTLQ